MIDGVLFSKSDKRLIYFPNTKKEYVVPKGVRIIGYQAFYDCNKLSSVMVTEGLTSIENHAFTSCISLSSITLSEGLTSIGDLAFSLCKNLSSITLPDSVESVGINPFREVNTTISVSPHHPYLAVVDSVLFSKPDKRLIYCPLKKEDYVVPEGIQIIGDYAFFACRELSSIMLPEGITSIGDGAFENCDNLSSITLPEGIQFIGSYAFHGCSNLTITVTRGSYAASYCKKNGLSYTYPDANDWLNS